MNGRSRSAWRVNSSRCACNASTDQSALARKWWNACGSALAVWARRGRDLRLVSAPGDQAEFKTRELFDLAHVGKHGAVVGAVVVNEGNGVRGLARLGHSGVSFLLDKDDTDPCTLYAHFDRTGMRRGVGSLGHLGFLWRGDGEPRGGGGTATRRR